MVLNLIFDRTIDDVDYALSLIKKWKDGTITEEEREEWFGGLRGAYNYTDLNRVGNAINLLIEKLNLAGYNFEYSAKTDWNLNDIPSYEELSILISTITKIRNSFKMFDSTPVAPSSVQKMTYNTANNFEKIIFDAYTLIDSAPYSYYYAGEIFAGV